MLDSNVKKGVNYIIGQIVLYWPCRDDIAIWAANLPLVMGHSFYYEQCHCHLECFKNLELQGKQFAPHDKTASGMSLSNYILISNDLYML
jgi:hypothetical protein